MKNIPVLVCIPVFNSENYSVDMVQGRSVFGIFPDNAISADFSSFIPCKINKCSTINIGRINGNLCYETFVNDKFSKIMCAKLIRRECYLEALDKIPLTYCNMNEEIVAVIKKFIRQKVYAGLENLKSLKEEDKQQGYEILCDIWGEKLVKEMEKINTAYN